jgi:hypothetical protein
MSGVSQLLELAEPFPPGMIERVKKGNRGAVDTVSHYHYVQKALAVVGPYDWKITGEIRGYVKPWIKKNTDEVLMPARENGLTGVYGELRVTIDGKSYVVQEPGTCENPHLETDGENAKKAASDAFKRCWMRLGMGTHLWADEFYVLPNALRKRGFVTAFDEDDIEPVKLPEPAVIREEPDPDESHEVPVSQPPPETRAPVRPDVEFDQADLTALLREIASDGTIPTIETRVRKLYMFMEAAGHWKGDMFHGALKKHYGADHWSDLGRKAVMQEFAEKSFAAARKTIEGAE